MADKIGHGHVEEHHDDHSHGGHHITPIQTYVKVLALLVVLTIATVAFAPPVSGLNLGIFSVILAFVIASTKAGFVLAIFMGLKWDSRLNLAIFFTAIFTLMILLVVCFTDIYSRIAIDSTL